MKKLCLILALVLLITGFAACKKQEAEETREIEYAMSTENFGITKEMVKYYFNSKYRSFINVYSGYLDNIGLDKTEPLSQQTCTIDATAGSWYDYFMNQVKAEFADFLVIAEESKREGLALSKSEKKEIDDNLELLQEYADENGQSVKEYIYEIYGRGVTSDDIRQCLELQALSSKFYKEFAEDLELEDSDLEEFFAARTKTYSKIDYLVFETFGLQNQDSTERIEAAKQANKLADSKSPEDFLNNVSEYLINYYLEAQGGDYDAKEVKKVTEEARSNCLVTGASFDATSPALSWGFDEERKAGDTTVFEDKETGKYTICYIVKPLYREEYHTVDIRQIFFSVEDYDSLLAAEEAAKEVKAELIRKGFSDELFLELSEEYSSDDATKHTGGKYESLLKTSTREGEDLVSDWVFSESRAEGDCEIISQDEGCYLIYIEAFQEEAWKHNTRNGIKEYEFELYLNKLGDECVIDIDSTVIYSIDEVDIEAE